MILITEEPDDRIGHVRICGGDGSVMAVSTRNRKLARWATRKFKRLRRHRRRAEQWLRRVARRQPGLFAHWRLLYGQAG